MTILDSGLLFMGHPLYVAVFYKCLFVNSHRFIKRLFDISWFLKYELAICASQNVIEFLQVWIPDCSKSLSR